MAFSKDNTFIATGGTDKIVKIWNVNNNGKVIHRMKGHSRSIKVMCF